MKRLFILLSLCIPLHGLLAQVNNYATNISYLTEHLSFDEATTGLLLDLSLPFVQMDSFDGEQMLPVNEMDMTKFGLMYATMYGAALDSTTLLPHPDAYMDVMDSLAFGDPIPLAIFHYDYHRFREDAVELKLLEIVDSQLYNQPPIPTNG